MTTDPQSGSDLDDEITVAASDSMVSDVRAEIQSNAPADSQELAVWKTEEDHTIAPEDVQHFDAGSANRGSDEAQESRDTHDSEDPDDFSDEPTVIRGFGDDPTTPLDDQAEALVQDLRYKSEQVQESKDGGFESIVSAPDLGASLIGRADPPSSDTSFFEPGVFVSESQESDAVGAQSNGRTRRSGRFPIGLLVLAVLLVAVTITVVLAVLLGTSS